MQLAVQNYIDNPSIKFPGLHMYLGVNKSPTTLAKYHCMNDIVSFDCLLDGKIIVCSDVYGKIPYINILENCCVTFPRKNMLSCTQLVAICNISPNGKVILVGGITEMIGIDGSTMPLLEDDDNNITACVFSPNEKYILGWSYYADSCFCFSLYSRNGLSYAILCSSLE